MGLDMYAYRVKAEDAIGDFEIARGEDGYSKTEDLAYWRKFNALHGWMEDLYYAKGGTKESFNCVPVRLSLDDLDRLQRAIGENTLTPTEGFFFGSQTIYPEDLANALSFVLQARQVIKEGDAVYYDSWW